MGGFKEERLSFISQLYLEARTLSVSAEIDIERRKGNVGAVDMLSQEHTN